ncbi:MAG: DNA translocase FtsK 4TM domain-containing protein, partial [Candidatus Cryptobacteroides sp.]
MDRSSMLLFKRIVGGILLVAGIYVFICCLSYLFTWKSDYSILGWEDISALPANLGAKLGLKLSWFLVGGCFGLSAFCVPVLLAILGLHLCETGRYRLSFKTAVTLLIATPLFSFILSYVSGLVSDDHFFGGGLGGFAGAECIRLCETWAGPIGTGLILLVCLVLWLLLASRRFALWFVKERPVREPESVQESPESAEALETESAGTAEPVEPEALPENVQPLDGETVTEESAGGSEAAEEDETGSDDAAEEAGKDVIMETKELDLEVREELPRIDNRTELERFVFPSLELLEDYASSQHNVPHSEQVDFIQRIRTTLQNFRIRVQDITAIPGPTVTLYRVIPAPGVKLASIKNIQNDIGISLGAKGVRVVKLDDAVGIEVANRKSSIVPLKAMLNDQAFRETKAELPVAIGCTITRQDKIFDLCQAPHLLVAGATQQGKSVGLNVIVSSLLYAKHPSELKFVFVDPKMVEFSSYGRLLKHYLAVLPTSASEE